MGFNFGAMLGGAATQIVEDINEKEKDEFLREKHKHLLDSTEENVIDVFVILPKYKTGNWIVQKRVKSGTWPFSDKEEDIEVMQISDENLTDIIQNQ